MAYVKIKCVKTGTHLQQVIDYIQNPEKTDNRILLSSFMCSTKNTAKQFQEISQYARHYGNNIAHHICQSFSPEDNISPQQALEIGQELMRRIYPNHQYVMATHIDRGHIHNHILVNAVNFNDYKKIHSNAYNLDILRKTSDNLCKENGLSVIEADSKNHRERLKKVIDLAVENSNNFDEFLGFMQYKGYEIKRGKYLYFKGCNNKVFLNTKSLGTAYTEKNLRAKIESHTEVKNHKVHIYDDKIVKMSHRKRLKLTVDDALKTANDYEDFLNIMRSEDYEIKFGKHLAFKHITGERFIRSESIGFEYTEEMFKLFFTNSEEYKKLKKSKIERLSSPDKSYNKYNAMRDIDIEISMLNYLTENGIKSCDELISNIEKCRKQAEINVQNINNINTQISEKKDIIKALRMYWQYKPIFMQMRSIKSPQEKELYLVEHKSQLVRYNNAVELISRSKKADGTLPKATDLNLVIEKLQSLKDAILTRQNKVKADLITYENCKYNLNKILDEKTTKAISKSQILISENSLS